MKTSELIEKLQELINENGDLEVYSYDDHHGELKVLDSECYKFYSSDDRKDVTGIVIY